MKFKQGDYVELIEPDHGRYFRGKVVKYTDKRCRDIKVTLPNGLYVIKRASLFQLSAEAPAIPETGGADEATTDGTEEKDLAGEEGAETAPSTLADELTLADIDESIDESKAEESKTEGSDVWYRISIIRTGNETKLVKKRVTFEEMMADVQATAEPKKRKVGAGKTLDVPIKSVTEGNSVVGVHETEKPVAGLSEGAKETGVYETEKPVAGLSEGAKEVGVLEAKESVSETKAEVPTKSITGVSDNVPIEESNLATEGAESVSDWLKSQSRGKPKRKIVSRRKLVDTFEGF